MYNRAAMELKLTNHQKKHLKGLAHGKKPIVTIGNNGLSTAVIEEMRLALDHHELIKIKLPAGDKSLRLLLLEDACKHCGATQVTLIGRTGVVFKPSEKNKVSLPT